MTTLSAIFILLSCSVDAFITPNAITRHTQSFTAMSMMIDPSAASSSSSFLLAATEPWVQPAIYILDPFLNIMSLLMLIRVVISWYPEVDRTEWWVKASIRSTEGLLRAVKGFVPPAFGVDITPVFWVAVFTFVHEILLGQQGLLVMKLKYGI